LVLTQIVTVESIVERLARSVSFHYEQLLRVCFMGESHLSGSAVPEKLLDLPVFLNQCPVQL
jgi:hypothetical protein